LRKPSSELVFDHPVREVERGEGGMMVTDGWLAESDDGDELRDELIDERPLLTVGEEPVVMRMVGRVGMIDGDGE
jgi:hypothetical protein